ncbi:hypothetical protein [uncultured Algoriphagus sp.]|uniref:hypothetical protein n=1 Tax=uncultured Algoriphagus sp. TaxID=417365 RepID=UPI0030EF89D1|tara:strand:+ start:36128 stop:36544 length:417 start_codon:yes stop_codon:yes gene_type:complete
MSNKNAYTKIDFLRLMLTNADAISENDESVKIYAHDEGIDLDKVKSEGKQSFKRMMLRLNAEKTRTEMQSNQSLKEMALEIVDKLMEKANFSFESYIIQNSIPMHNRNLEKLSDTDIKNTLIQYHYLKLIEKSNLDKK